MYVAVDIMGSHQNDTLLGECPFCGNDQFWRLCNTFMVRFNFDASTGVWGQHLFGFGPHGVGKSCKLASPFLALQECKHTVAHVTNSTKLMCKKKSFPAYFARDAHLTERHFQPLKKAAKFSSALNVVTTNSREVCLQVMRVEHWFQ